MPIPNLIPIARIPDCYTKNIGTYADSKRFMGSVVAQFSDDDDPDERTKWYAILHKFDNHGNYLSTLSWYAGTSAQGEDEVVEAAKSKLDEFIETLSNVKFQNIAVKLFEVKIDGYIFALRQMTEDDYAEADSDMTPNLDQVVLEPDGFVFSTPWDGDYDT